jgi:hypothetical protein
VRSGELGDELTQAPSGGARGRLLAGRGQFCASPLGERRHADRGEHAVGDVQLLARVDAAVFAAQPLAVQEVRAGQIRALLGAPEPADRLAVPALGRIVAAQQGPRARLDAQPEIGSAGLSRGRQPVQRVRRQRGLTRTDRGFDQLGPRPVGKRPLVVPVACSAAASASA